MARFMMLLYENPAAFVQMTPDQIQGVIQRYVEWRERMAAEGKVVGGNKLRSDQGQVLEPNGDRVLVRDGPYGESKELIGGYFILDATDYAEAAALAKQCPHFELDAVAVLREIEPT